MRGADPLMLGIPVAGTVWFEVLLVTDTILQFTVVLLPIGLGSRTPPVPRETGEYFSRVIDLFDLDNGARY